MGEGEEGIQTLKIGTVIFIGFLITMAKKDEILNMISSLEKIIF